MDKRTKYISFYLITFILLFLRVKYYWLFIKNLDELKLIYPNYYFFIWMAIKLILVFLVFSLLYTLVKFFKKKVLILVDPKNYNLNDSHFNDQGHYDYALQLIKLIESHD